MLLIADFMGKMCIGIGDRYALAAQPERIGNSPFELCTLKAI